MPAARTTGQHAIEVAIKKEMADVQGPDKTTSIYK
jgi:hypothetical protein